MSAAAVVGLPSTGSPSTGAPGGEVWHLRLYVAGASPNSLKAFANLTQLCEEHLAGRFEIEVIDLTTSPVRARTDDIVAIPTLVRWLPEPVRRVIGDLSQTDRVLLSLQVPGARS